MIHLIGITGKMGSGKTTVANILANKPGNIEILPFSKPLKDIAYQMGWDGQKDIKGRRLLQLLGTECGRECISQDIWVKKWIAVAYPKAKVSHTFGRSAYNNIIIADDVRFDNEEFGINKLRETLRKENLHCQSWIIHMERPNSTLDCENAAVHASETGLTLNNIPPYWIHNVGALEDLDHHVDKFIQYINRDIKL